MRDLKKLRNLTVVVFVFLFLNFVLIKDFSSDNEKPMIVVEEYYYYGFGGIEIRYPNFLNDEELKEFEFERVENNISFFRYVGENNTGYEIYIKSKIGRIGKSADLTLVTAKTYKTPGEITFGEIENIFYDKNLIELRETVLKKFVEEGIENKQGDTSNYYKLPLIYCMVENCNIGMGEDKKIFKWDTNFKNKRKITEGPYSAQNEKGQIIVWTALEKHILPGEGDKNADKFLYLINAYERGIMGGGFEIDKTFMRNTINDLVEIYGKDSTRNLEILSERSLSFDLSTSFIKEDKIAKWTIFPYLFTRYKGYHFLYDLDYNYFGYPFDYYLKQTKMNFVYTFDQEELEKNSKDLRQVINSQILYIFDSVKEKNENYKNISEAYHLAMKNFDNIYLVIAAIYGIAFGFATLLWKIFRNKIENFWKYIPKYEKRALLIILLTVVISIIAYIIGYDAIIIHKINQVKVVYPYYLMTNTEKNWALLFSLVAAGLWVLWSFREDIIKKLREKYSYLGEQGYF